jgi:hypothetical protein
VHRISSAVSCRASDYQVRSQFSVHHIFFRGELPRLVLSGEEPVLRASYSSSVSCRTFPHPGDVSSRRRVPRGP